MIWWQLLLVIVANFVSIMVGVVFVNFMNMRRRNAEIRGLMKGIIAKVETEMDFSDIVNRNFINDDGGDNDIR
jgi:hypothetical protein